MVVGIYICSNLLQEDGFLMVAEQDSDRLYIRILLGVTLLLHFSSTSDIAFTLGLCPM